MSDQGFRSPSAWWIAAGLVLTMALCALLFTLPATVKRVGNVLLFLPSQLGLVRRVSPDEVRTISLASSLEARLELEAAGRYLVFTDQHRVLISTESLLQQHGAPVLHVRSEMTGEALAVSFVDRGMAPYDTPLAPGRPIYSFEVHSPGAYVVSYPPPFGAIAVVPDYTTGRERVIVLSYLVQVAILLAPLGLLVCSRFRRQRRRVRSIVAAQAQRRSQSDAFWQAESEKQRRKGGTM